MAVVVAGVLLAACGADSLTEDAEPLDGIWELAAATVDGEQITLLDDYRVTATITGDEIRGRAACNSYSATMLVAGDEVTFTEQGWTAMLCDAPVMVVEEAFEAAFDRVTSISRSGSVLRLSGPEVELEFALLAPAPMADLIEVTWMLSEIVQGGTVTSAAEGADGPGDKAMLVLNEDGTLTGHTGCRELSGEYVVRGDEILFTSFSADGLCVPELEWQDNQVVGVLGDGFTAEIAGSKLTVTSPGGDRLVFRAGP